MTKSSGFDDNVGDDGCDVEDNCNVDGDDGCDGDDNGNVDGDDSGNGDDYGNVDGDDGVALVIGDKQAVAAQLQGHRQALS